MQCYAGKKTDKNVHFPPLCSVQGLKGQKLIEIQGNMWILYRNYVYVLITGISLLFEKQQHEILQKQGKPCK